MIWPILLKCIQHSTKLRVFFKALTKCWKTQNIYWPKMEKPKEKLESVPGWECGSFSTMRPRTGRDSKLQLSASKQPTKLYFPWSVIKAFRLIPPSCPECDSPLWKWSCVVYSSRGKYWHTYFVCQDSSGNFFYSLSYKRELLLLTTTCSSGTVEVKWLCLSSESNSHEMSFFLPQQNKGFQERWHFKSNNFLIYKFYVIWSNVFCSSATWSHVGPE